MRRTLFAVSREAITADYKHISPLKDVIKQLTVINETPKGYRCETSYTDKGTVYRHSNWYFFLSITDALHHVASAASQTAANLETRKLGFIMLLFEAHHALRAEADKDPTCAR